MYNSNSAESSNTSMYSYSDSYHNSVSEYVSIRSRSYLQSQMSIQICIQIQLALIRNCIVSSMHVFDARYGIHVLFCLYGWSFIVCGGLVVVHVAAKSRLIFDFITFMYRFHQLFNYMASLFVL